jgi:hypothetical protein
VVGSLFAWACVTIEPKLTMATHFLPMSQDSSDLLHSTGSPHTLAFSLLGGRGIPTENVCPSKDGFLVPKYLQKCAATKWGSGGDESGGLQDVQNLRTSEEPSSECRSMLFVEPCSREQWYHTGPARNNARRDVVVVRPPISSNSSNLNPLCQSRPFTLRKPLT